MMPLGTILPAVQQHAAQCAPRECCGLIVGGAYVPCRNIAGEAAHFALHPADFAAAEDSGLVQAVVHSHVFVPPMPSPADVAACNASGLPWLIVNHPTGAHAWLQPDAAAHHAPLIGREFVHGVHDCYALVRDWYAEHGIALRNYARTDNWWEHGANLYRENFAAEGFIELPPGDAPQWGDALLLQVASRVENHAAIYLGDNRILHHIMQRLSRVDLYSQPWQQRTCAVLRHPELRPPC